MDAKKQILVNSVISFLHNELNGSTLNEEKKESLEVAIQCLETAFEAENQSNVEEVDLLSLIDVKLGVKPTVEVTEEQKLQAEEFKNKGNNCMKNSEYQKAIEEYTKAIELNPYNAVYYCNRAAAYTRLMKDLDAINDCNEAIKLDPTYGKAYGRLGIAYSNLNKCDLALQAYQTALKYDPTNTMYETNLKVAQERLRSNPGGAAPTLDPRQLPNNLSEFINHPNVINMANQMLSDQSFHNLMSGLIDSMSGSGEGMPAAVETMLQAGQVLAQRVANEDPDFYNRVGRNAQAATQAATQAAQAATQVPSSNSDSNEQSKEKPEDKESA